MSKILLDQEKCKGCYYCVSACKKEALYITEKINKKGFKVVAVDEERCIACAACYEVCPDLVFEIKE